MILHERITGHLASLWFPGGPRNTFVPGIDWRIMYGSASAGKHTVMPHGRRCFCPLGVLKLLQVSLGSAFEWRLTTKRSSSISSTFEPSSSVTSPNSSIRHSTRSSTSPAVRMAIPRCDLPTELPSAAASRSVPSVGRHK
jgi:hypothetical protein